MADLVPSDFCYFFLLNTNNMVFRNIVGTWALMLLVYIAIWAAVLFAGYWGVKKIASIYSKEKTEMSTYLNKSVVVGKDTLVIVNFSVLSSEFYTSSGETLGEELVKNHTINE